MMLKNLTQSIGLILALGFLLGPGLLQGQNITSTAINGTVRDPGGATIGDVSIRAVHGPTGTVFTATIRPNGRYNLRGMRVGGPYTLVISTLGYRSETRSGVYLALRQDQSYDFTLALDDAEVVSLEAYEVVADQYNLTFSADNFGATTNVSSADLQSLPTVSRSLTDFARLDPRVTVFDRESGAISAAGQNNRYNSIMIDGVPTNDTFGLEENGLPSLTQPFSLDTIAEISVETSPYDILQAGFTGATINAITKSGTNEFKGSFYYYFRNEGLTGKRLEFTDLTDGPDGTFLKLEGFDESTTGFTFGGPIIKDKLFFFVAFERFKRTEIPPVRLFDPTPKDLADIIDLANEYGFDAGTLDTGDDKISTDDKILVKLDWNINDNHRLTFRYTRNDGDDPQFPSFGGSSSTSLSSYWFTRTRENSNFVTELFSKWSDRLSTEAKISFSKFIRTSSPNSDAPQVQISSVEGIDGNNGSINFGRISGEHSNFLEVKTTIMQFHADYFLGNHTLTAGVNIENVANNNLFIRNSRGSWRFNNVAEFRGAVVRPGEPPNDAFAANYNVSYPVGDSEGSANWSLTTFSFFAKDTWDVTESLKITAGIRADIPTVDDKIPLNEEFVKKFGREHTGTVDGNSVIQPRVGFNWALDEDRKTQLRGGGGLFYGTAPHVWLSNPFVNNGVTIISSSPTRRDVPEFSSDGDNPPIPDTVQPTFAVDLLDEEFKMPSSWKSNIAIDRKLSWWNMQLTLEAQWSWTKNDIHYQHLNLAQDFGRSLPTATGFLPDGRNLYDKDPSGRREFEIEGFDNVFLLTNTSLGKSANYTIKLEKPKREGFYWSFGYTYGSAKSVNDGRGSSASSIWGANKAKNPNDNTTATSDFEVRHRLVGVVSYQMKLLKNSKTTVSMVYDGRTGRPFSYTYFRTDMNRDSNFSNDLIYIPSGRDDPLVLFTRETEKDAFWEFVENNRGLSLFKGQVVPRNTGRDPWIHQFDFKFVHEVTFLKRHRVEFSAAILNIGNLINSDWGLIRRTNSGNFPLLEARHFPDGSGNTNGKFVYRFLDSLLDEDRISATTQLSSRWSILMGVKYRF